MNDKIEHKGINSLYFLKGICAFLVVCCHAPWAGELNQWIAPLKTAAVPFFITISGYFLYSNDVSKMYRRLLRGLKKLFVLIVLCNIFYILLTLPKHGLMITTLRQVVNLLLYGNAVIEHLWYLTACFWGFAFYAFALFILQRISQLQKKRDKLFTSLCLLLLPLYLLAVISEAYRPWTYNALGGYVVYSAIPYALPFLSLGFLIRKNEKQLLRHSWTMCAGVMLLLLLGEFLLCCILRGTAFTGLIISSMPFVGTIFLLLLQKDTVFSDKDKIVLIGRRYSGNIYYWHMVMITVGMKLATMLSIPMEVYNWVAAPIVFLMALCFSIIVVQVQEKLSLSIFP